ncbi:uncharacterized protein TOT_040000288 [Theileria orientalis strain Shintoku]|uniref:GATA-type domain-containing protein n=1 Tax=Theileria orientalis strain Shintoku TaxID=869250 RepID=J4C947_THEOR|nr:uncharacterized protein TOT_040000288 [Theileria orientalis strain Shintoku]BAM41908.1 uncharacterized protein TOT_040000288 [Theileria orientalis strain Shintoku]|eukprot:XP_009692209.1 uncharacterized protein TOT_040000288 [Theileria orientalis strain Shintoku]
MNDFKKDTDPSVDNINIAGRNKTEPAVKHDLYSMNEQESSFKYNPVYYMNQSVNSQMMAGKPLAKMQEFEKNVPASDALMPSEYEGNFHEGLLIPPKDEYKNSHLPQFSPSKNIDSGIGSDLIQCIKSPETSPNLLPSSLEKYSMNSGIDILPMVNELDHGNLIQVNDCENKYGVVANGQAQKARNVYNYQGVNYNKQELETVNVNKRFYYPTQFSQQTSQNKRNLDGNLGFFNYNGNKNLCYFNGIRVEYDEKTKSYHPNYEVVDENNPNVKYRQQMIPNEKVDNERVSPLFNFISNSQDYNLNNPYYEIESYYKNSSLKHDMMNPSDDGKYRSEALYQPDPIARKPKRDRKKTVKTGSSAGRPRLNRNHYSCANCNAKSTPQWRYVTGVAVCNACYMRMRKDKIFPGHFNKNKGNKNE